MEEIGNLEETRANLAYIQACFSKVQIDVSMERIKKPLDDIVSNHIWRGSMNRRRVIAMKNQGLPTKYIAAQLGLTTGRVNTIWLQEIFDQKYRK